ncbi:MAG: DUF6089 family protein [Bacteroidales bacterium]|nr:DUF6089 family protein [Bacteroidales bacterium]
MKKLTVILYTLFAGLFAQQHEIGILAGGMYYMGDLNPLYPFLQTQPSAGGMYRYNFNSRMSLRLQVLYGSIRGDDKVSSYYPERKLSFQSSLLELAGIYELTYKKFIIGSEKYSFTPYLFTGITFTRFNPVAIINDETYYLHQFGTEGQGTTAYPDRKNYSLVTVSLPFGMGIKWNVTGSFVFGVEWGMRMTFTDYLDDCSKTYPDPQVILSQNGAHALLLSDPSYYETGGKKDFDRGNHQTKDWYGWAGLVCSFKIKDKSESCYSGRRNKDRKSLFQKLKKQNQSIFNR